MKTIALALTGASGLPYGLRLLEKLLAADCRVWLLVSQAARVVAKQELDLVLPAQPQAVARLLTERYGTTAGSLAVYGNEDWNAPLASGSNAPDAYVVCPCSMGTLAKVAAGFADDLIARAADVVLKEGRNLVLVPRETPLSAIHLENMLKLARAGAVILPPSPGFYHGPRSIDDLVDFVVARILDQLGIEHDLLRPWGEP